MIAVKPFRQTEHKSCKSFNQANQGSDNLPEIPAYTQSLHPATNPNFLKDERSDSEYR